MPTFANSREAELADLQSWYLDRLRPKLAQAANAGKIPATAVLSLDRELTELLELGREPEAEAA